ncbi:MAG: PilX N-terminal domain-containing pilus assembly protein, partial [Arenimonas sp.]
MIYSTTQLKLSAALEKQRGVTTLAITLLLLVILTLIVLFSTNVAFFEQRTATSENRERLAQQAAEYGLNLAGEYIKAKVSLVSSTQTNGWLNSGSLKWAKCADVGTMTANHPCMAERNTVRRQELYYFSADGTDISADSSELLDLNGATNASSFTTVLPTGSRITKVGGESQTAGDFGEFGMTPRLQALLCRLDVSDSANPQCSVEPGTNGGNQIVLTLISQSTLSGENATSTIKESWASVTAFSGAAAVPLVASGLVQGLGNATIVAAPNGGGSGDAGGSNLPISIWSPKNVDIDASGTGVGSVQTCHRTDYHEPFDDVKTACAANNACSCTAFAALRPGDELSGHSGAVKLEGKDIWDVDGDHAGLDIT